jgi:hypothetical protein
MTATVGNPRFGGATAAFPRRLVDEQQVRIVAAPDERGVADAADLGKVGERVELQHLGAGRAVNRATAG